MDMKLKTIEHLFIGVSVCCGPHKLLVQCGPYKRTICWRISDYVLRTTPTPYV